jgi:hypothetical protein
MIQLGSPHFVTKTGVEGFEEGSPHVEFSNAAKREFNSDGMIAQYF